VVVGVIGVIAARHANEAADGDRALPQCVQSLHGIDTQPRPERCPVSDNNTPSPGNTTGVWFESGSVDHADVARTASSAQRRMQ